MRNRWGLVVLVAAVSFFSGGWLLQGASARPAVDGPQLFGDVLEYVSKYYVDSLKSDEIYEKASHGLVDELGDPYSALMEAEDYKQITEQTTGNYGEIFERNVGPKSALQLPRGLNNLWNKGGIMYAYPVR